MFRRRTIASVALTAAVLSTAACAPTPLPDPWDEPARVLWTHDDEALGPATTSGGVSVGLVAGSDAGVQVLARDQHSGAELWRADARIGGEAPGVAAHVATDGDRVSFLAARSYPGDHRWATPVMVDIRTGEEISAGMPGEVMIADRPDTCDDAFCVTGRLPSSRTESTWELPVDAGRGARWELASRDDSRYLETGRFLGHYVSESRASGAERLSFGRAGRIEWSRDYSEVFGEGASSDGGWHWHDSTSDPIVGWGTRHVALPKQPGKWSLDLAATRVVGLDRATGATRWSRDGVISCAAIGYTLHIDDDVVIGCRFRSGRQSVMWDGTSTTPLSLTDVDADVVAIDAKTGDVRWSVPIDPASPSAAVLDGDDGFLRGGTPMIQVGSRLTTIDVATGDTATLPADAVLLCERTGRRYTLPNPWSRRESSERAGARRVVACTADGREAPLSSITNGALEFAGFDTTAVSIVHLDSGTTAFGPRVERLAPTG